MCFYVSLDHQLIPVFLFLLCWV